MANVFAGFGSTPSSVSQHTGWPPSAFGVFGQPSVPPITQPTTAPSPVLSFNQSSQQSQPTQGQQDKGQIIQCLTESKNVQLAILNELKQISEKMIKSQQQVQAIQQSKHMGVFCNRCMKNDIIGVRYKCLFCKDFDMCEQCEQEEGSHNPSHYLIKIKDTNTFNSIMAQKPAFFSL